MRSFLRLPFVAAAAALLTVSAWAAAPGEVDFATLATAPDGKFVEVNLEPGLLKLAARFAEKEEPAVAELVRNLTRVRVNVVTVDDSNRSVVGERFASVRQLLAKQGWTAVATVRGDDGEDVAVHVKMKGEETVEGLVVTVLNGKDKEAVFVNIVGNIRPEQLSDLATKFDLPGLKSARIAKAD